MQVAWGFPEVKNYVKAKKKDGVGFPGRVDLTSICLPVKTLPIIGIGFNARPPSKVTMPYFACM
jgi:hypothetical protein